MAPNTWRFSLSVIGLMVFLAVFLAGFKPAGAEVPSLTGSAKCKECHQEIFDSWKNTTHALSIEDPIFKAAYMEAYLLTKGEVKFNCLPCHAPAVQINKDFDMEKDITKEGVTCDICHSITKINLADRHTPFKFEIQGVKRGPLSDVVSPAHKTELSTLFKSAELCAGCHEYVNDAGVTVLGTYSEWKNGPYAAEGKQCQDCHMPLIAGRVVKDKIKSSNRKLVNLHDISAGHSVEQLKKAVQVELKDISADKNFIVVSVDVTNVGSGHMVPTGLPKRKLALIVDVKTPKDYLSQQKIFQRIMTDDKGNEIKKDWAFFMNGVKNFADNRIKPREKKSESFTFVRPKNDDITVSARVEYLYETKVLNPVEMRVVMAEASRKIAKQ
jgi:Cytochrome c554 and c-prime